MLTDAERFEFDLRGYLVRPQAVAPELVERLRQALSRLEGKRPEELPANCLPTWTPAVNEYRLLNVLECDPVFSELIDQPALLAAADELVPRPYRLAEVYSITRLAGPGLPLHSVSEALYRCTPGGPRTQILKAGVWLSDVGPDDGPLVVIEGSHKSGVPFPFSPVPPDWEAPPNDAEFQREFRARSGGGIPRRWEEVAGFRELCVRAGDAVLWTDDLWHGAKAVRSARRRRSLHFTYVPYHFANWHGLQYSDELKQRVGPKRRALLAGPFAGFRYPGGRHGEIADELGFESFPNSELGPERFAIEGAPAGPRVAGGSGPGANGAVADALRRLAVPRQREDAPPRGACQFEVSGPGGGSWWVEVSDAGARLEVGRARRADCTCELTSADLLDLARGRESAVRLFHAGRVRVRGEVRLAMRLVDRWSPP